MWWGVSSRDLRLLLGGRAGQRVPPNDRQLLRVELVPNLRRRRQQLEMRQKQFGKACRATADPRPRDEDLRHRDPRPVLLLIRPGRRASSVRLRPPERTPAPVRTRGRRRRENLLGTKEETRTRTSRPAARCPPISAEDSQNPKNGSVLSLRCFRFLQHDLPPASRSHEDHYQHSRRRDSPLPRGSLGKLLHLPLPEQPGMMKPPMPQPSAPPPA